MTVCETFTCDRAGCGATKQEPLRSPDVAMGQSLPVGWICWPHTDPDLHFCSVACLELFQDYTEYAEESMARSKQP